jgi:hypothetical protein
MSYLRINASEYSFPVSSEADPRKLIFIINNISCYRSNSM